ncbi:Zn-dependent oxidoreductase [Pontimonas salivibrio]|uniref:Zn-dependent oxidoreductase n=2 Tax=Pontimonas salivibrio TaxID=1159327 RepID=A0A2L2BRC0_9MICO|nr:Zn-dependent oxidoreductase [Pontimonas salivibrio]
MRVAQYDRYGPPDVITLVHEPDPGDPGPDEVSVRVIAAGLNPADSKMRRGHTPIVDLPARIGREFSGIAIAVGENVTHVEVGQEVLGTGQGVMADIIVSPADLVMAKPDGITFDHAAVLPVAAQTAWAAVESQRVQPGDVVAVSAAAGGVGVVMCQLLRDLGAVVIGTASPRNHVFVEGMGAIPVDYHGDLVATLEEFTPKGLHHVFDNSGHEMIEAALQLGVPRQNINSISGDGPKFGVPTVGRVGLNRDIINALGAKIADGSLIIPIRTQPFDELKKAYIDLEEVGVLGKVVVRMDNTPEEDMPDLPPA